MNLETYEREMARWSLDRARIDCREERHVEGVHRLAAAGAYALSLFPSHRR